MTPRHRQFMALLSFDRCQQFFLSSAQIRSSPLRCKVLRYPSSLLATGKVRKSDLRTWASHPQAGRAHLITMCCCLLLLERALLLRLPLQMCTHKFCGIPGGLSCCQAGSSFSAGFVSQWPLFLPSRVTTRLGNRCVRVSDFSLQKLCFSALCGPN